MTAASGCQPSNVADNVCSSTSGLSRTLDVENVILGEAK
jgi:hypothetical protein